MSFRWDKLLPTKNTLVRYRNPTTTDALNYDHGVIWINQPDNAAWLLRDGTVTALPPTSGAAVDITDQADENIIPDGSNTGDIIRWNSSNGSWESCAEPFDFKQINLTPLSEAMEDIEGGMYYKSGDKSIMVCTEDA